ncbi:MAG TPA: phospholipase C, phosphocholine-specific [Chitinophaga sp.]|uniref:phosphocholine-specific phospholipase C n=1 Tax=Chitinophaga sp. TaxID=1869181 RepID=UPI002DBE6BB3|nr:phospholipase C, phosphocholine-specific [Chitinophaga sp.]HEU4555304.1 phospholipase C, phosphocholine-specific [Chitinophaga sp.]
MDTRREFLKKSVLLSGAAGLSAFMPASIQRALAIDPSPGSTWLDAEHIVILMQENRSFDHCFGTLRGVRGFNDPRALMLPDKKPVFLQTNERGETYAPFRLDIKDTKVTWMGSLPHSRASQVDANNNGKYDQWLLAKRSGNKQYAAMPLTMGYYNREDLPFNYAMADAFTICDQNFCSAMTSTTPNRSFFWTGKITHDVDGLPKAHIRNDDYSYAKLPWNTFPELLEQNNIAWKFYQNETSCGGGFKGEERSWLANFGCNLLEFFAAYNIKFAPRYIQSLQRQVDTLPDQINKLQEASPSTEEAAQKIRTELAKKQEVLDKAKAELAKWNQENFEKLTDEQKNLYRRAFVTNEGDPDCRNITKLSYTDGNEKREVTVPGGDVLYQFRKDVQEGKLPTVSWLAAPQNFSDHPSAPWYGAWYVSEILDILTQNPDVWKKTIFIVTYDENDGYFDHVPPFYIPDENKPGTGKVSAGIDTEIEHVRLANELKQGVPEKAAREAPIGLGFRVPMIIASPWSRGGKVCSQLFDHTSTIQFLETFVNQKYKKNIRQNNISAWRRTICGDLTSAFSPFNGDKLEPIPFLDRNKYVEDIYNAKFKQEPGGYKKLSDQEIRHIIRNPLKLDDLSTQEKGVRPSCALPYELYAEAQADKKQVTFTMQAGNKMHGKKAAGAPFTVYAPGQYKDGKGTVDVCRNWAFAVKPGDSLTYQWPLEAFENNRYHLRLYGPNGFYREVMGNAGDPALQIAVAYEQDAKTKKPTGNLVIKVSNDAAGDMQVAVKDHAYKTNDVTKTVAKGDAANIVLPLKNSHGWYDFSITINGFDAFEKRYAGRVETGAESFSDPFMGRV